MNRIMLAALAATGVIFGAFYLTRPPGQTVADTPPEGAALVSVTLPEGFSPEATLGQRAFDAVCADCHGENATGKMGFGPPLVHKIYETSHHGDMAFHMAVQNGVRGHHWTFGDMPAQSGLTRADVDNIIAYVRELQRANGID